MKTEIKEMFIIALRGAMDAKLPQAKGAEMVRFIDTTAYDAYGTLADLYCLNLSPSVGFVPTRRDPNEFFFLDRPALLAWSGLTPQELTDLIEMNDLGHSFGEIADVIEKGEWG